jgi:hypothetical protein
MVRISRDVLGVDSVTYALYGLEIISGSVLDSEKGKKKADG